MKNKIIAVVKFNDGEALVLENEPKMVYTKYGNDTIIGTDGVFYSFYGYERSSPNWQAFAGRKFTIELENGDVVNCEGEWWDKITETAIKILGINSTDNKVVYATANSIDQLSKCYVFIGYKGLSSKIAEFRKTYTGEVYGYWDYEKMIKQNLLKV